MTNTKLSDLPIDLQSKILLNLSPWINPYRGPSDCTIHSAEMLNTALPDSLLDAALASRALSRSVIHALGPHTKILNFNRSMRLSQWISVLKYQVKAVSLAGCWDLGFRNTSSGNLLCCYSADVKHKYILEALTALHANDIALEVLDLQELSNIDIKSAKEIAEHAILAIKKCGSSLRELALSINSAGLLAMTNVTFPNLKVAQISSDDHVGMGGLVMHRTQSPANGFGDVLKTISGNTNRESNVCTVRNLSLINLRGSPNIDNESCDSLFSAVEELFIEGFETSKNSEIAQFIANFRNLKSLGWFTEWTCPEDMSKIVTGCRDLNDISLYVRNRRIFPGEVVVAQNSSKLRDLFLSFRGKQRVLGFQSYLSHDQVLCLAQSSPSLAFLEMEVDLENLGALSLLLGTHCRKLLNLCLCYSQEAVHLIGRDFWPALSQAICSASDGLSQLSVIINSQGWIFASTVQDMVEAIIDILKFMGDHASYIAFQFPINTQNPFIVLEALRTILNVVKNHNRSLLVLCLDFVPHDQYHEYRIDISDHDDFMDLFREVSYLRREFASFENPIGVNLGEMTFLLDNLGITWD